METALNSGKKYIGSRIRTAQVALAAGTYYPGQRLEQTAGVYADLTTGDMAGVYNGDAERTEVAQFEDNIITGGGIVEAGLVDNAGDPVVVSAADRATYRPLGFYVEDY